MEIGIGDRNEIGSSPFFLFVKIFASLIAHRTLFYGGRNMLAVITTILAAIVAGIISVVLIVLGVILEFIVPIVVIAAAIILARIVMARLGRR